MQQQVIIVGGGMVGLSLALMLAKAKIEVKLLEAIQYPQFAEGQQEIPYHSSFDARNSALSRRSVQIYQQLGLWDVLQQHATPILQVHITEQGSFGKARLVAEQENVESFGQVIENAWLGRVLLTQVRQQPLIELIDGIQVTALTQNAEQVTIQAKRGEEELKFTSKLLIAADGRDSLCRQALGVGVDEHDYDQVAIVTTVQTSKPHQHVGFERFSPLGPLALLPLPGEYRRSVVWPVKKGTEHEWLGEENDQHFLDALQQTYGDRAGCFEKTGKRFCYPLSQVLAHQQAVGRVVIMGNAAHTLHPVAGQGFNLCLRDADVLLRFIRHQLEVSDDIGDAEMLKAYEQSRLKDQQRVIKFCDSVVRGFSNNNPVLKVLRNAGLIAFDVIPGVKPLVASYAMGLKA
ncbi:2-octaprenyl-6-methoxyphenyl hydroxylase [Acinetobacter brisouii]|uniref:2-octaprenyl-6-methoxyphenyl hydroxylase n=1 Tax=Acinetobacter brisouii TaxID=396323 RepID=UPI00125009A2|nr:2-octaprenyl-6-methoxyphenyl hydroxylase [Acinetobacter brisouii]